MAQHAPQTDIDNFLGLGTLVPWDPVVWEQHVDRIVGHETKLTSEDAVKHFVDLCTVVRTPGNKGVPREAIVFVGTRLAYQCRELGTFSAICKALFAETEADRADTDMSHIHWTGNCLVDTAGENTVVPQHLAFLYEQADRPRLSCRQVMRFVSQELYILRYSAEEGNELYGDGLPLEWLRGVFDRNQRKFLDKMATVAVFGEERVRTALQAVHQSEFPMGCENDEDIPEGESVINVPILHAYKALEELDAFFIKRKNNA